MAQRAGVASRKRRPEEPTRAARRSRAKFTRDLAKAGPAASRALRGPAAFGIFVGLLSIAVVARSGELSLGGATASRFVSALEAVEDSPNDRSREYGGRYFEWRIPALPGIRYVASGYEDGIDYSLYRVTKEGGYELIVRVNPIVLDAEGRLGWGYPWVTTGLVLERTPEGIRFLATFDHQIVRDGVISVPEWQKSIPALLLRGDGGKSDSEFADLIFTPFGAAGLGSVARREAPSSE